MTKECKEFLEKYHAHEELTIDDCVDVIESLFDALDTTIERLDREESEKHMGAFDKAKDILVPNDEKPEEAAAFRKKWGWEPHEQIIMRGKMTAGIQEEISNASTVIGADNTAVIQTGSGRMTMLEHMIVRWTLTRGGGLVDVNVDTIRELPMAYTTPLFEVCDELAKGVMSEEQQKTFLHSANGHTKANLGVVK
jgi:hypothetical protein